MASIKHAFSIYIVIVMLLLGLYMVFIQSKYLMEVDHFERESKWVKGAGWFYIILSGVGFIITLL